MPKATNFLFYGLLCDFLKDFITSLVQLIKIFTIHQRICQLQTS